MTKCLKVIYKKEENNMNTEITKKKKYTIEQLGTKLEKLESLVEKYRNKLDVMQHTNETIQV